MQGTRAWTEVIRPEWPAPGGVFACTTTRFPAPCESDAAGGEGSRLDTRPEALQRALGLPSRPVFLRQAHGVGVVEANMQTQGVVADACFTRRAGTVCGVLTADCVPVLFCTRGGERLAAAHAGWRGLAAGVLEATVTALDVAGRDLLAWLGPAIGPDAFEVGADVRERFCAVDPGAGAAFKQCAERKWLADLYWLCRMRLASVGVESVYGGGFCTYSDSRFYSYRRDGPTGRMASLIWRE